MTLTEKIGQRLVGGFPGPEMSGEFIRLVQTYKIGNVILFQHNVESSEQLLRLCRSIQELVRRETGHGAFITIDQEGGAVTRLPRDAVNVPGAMALAATGDPENAYRAARLTAAELRAFGIHFNLAPSVDVNCNPDNPIIGVRSFGDTPEQVARYGLAALRGYREGGVLCSAKHFPGHGDTAMDTHVSLPCIDKSLDQLEACELKPFQALIDAGCPAVMTTHILFPRLEPDNVPATMSRRIITGLLKERMGFAGLVVSDCMEMDAIARYYGTARGAAAAMAAGVDLVFVSHTAASLEQAALAVREAVESGEISIEEMDASVEKILRLKAGFCRPPEGVPGMAEAMEESDALRRASVTLVRGGIPEMGGSPFFCGCAGYRAGLVSNREPGGETFPEFFAGRFGGDFLVTGKDPDRDEIRSAADAARGHSSIFVGTYNGHLFPGQLELVKELGKLGIPMVVTALRNPYDLRAAPEGAAAIAAWEYSPAALQALIPFFAGEQRPQGILPVRLEAAPVPFAAGIDGGGTKTKVECRDRQGRTLRRKTFGPFNLNSVGEDAFTALLEEITAFLRETGDCAAVCAGAAGISNPRVRELMAQAMERAGITRWQLVGDHEIALHGALSGQPGCVLIAGTGSICCGKNGRGEFVRTGGWGHLIDDGGSGYALGRDALAAVARQWDGRGGKTLLSEAVSEQLGIQTPQELAAYVYGGDKSRVAAAAPLVEKCAGEGDETALRIYARAGEELAALAAAAARQLGLARCEVALLGGALEHDAYLRGALQSRLAEIAPGLRCVAPRQDAAAGAALMAAALAWPREEERQGVMALARELELPAPVHAPLERALEAMPELSAAGLTDPETAGAAWEKLSEVLPAWHEDDGMAQLAVTLSAARLTREIYRENHISDDVYQATMACLCRFLGETHEITGKWAFDRGFWTWRQTSGQLFRLGTLEFEYRLLGDIPPTGALTPESPVLSVHIPSDAALSREELERSYGLAADFFREHEKILCRYGAPEAVLCGSWLMSPALDELLPADSGIRRFAGGYTRYDVQEDDQSFYRWLFGSLGPTGNLPERTGLQRAVKAHLAAGGKIGMAWGILHAASL